MALPEPLEGRIARQNATASASGMGERTRERTTESISDVERRQPAAALALDCWILAGGQRGQRIQRPDRRGCGGVSKAASRTAGGVASAPSRDQDTAPVSFHSATRRSAETWTGADGDARSRLRSLRLPPGRVFRRRFAAARRPAPVPLPHPGNPPWSAWSNSARNSFGVPAEPISSIQGPCHPRAGVCHRSTARGPGWPVRAGSP